MKQKNRKPDTKTVTNNSLLQLALWPLSIAVVVLIVFWPSVNNGFTNWDDPSLITENPLIKNLNAQNFQRIFTENYFGNYQPLHLLSYAIEFRFFGLQAKGYHAVSVVMHALNTVLVFFLLQTLFKNQNKILTALLTLLWAVNPMRTESVCWAAERKDLLYALFFFAALLAYLKYIKANEKVSTGKMPLGYLAIAFLFFILSVFSKAMAVSLIPVLFLTDYYFNRKFSLRLIAEKIPFIALAVIMGLKSISAASAEGSVNANTTFAFTDRVFFAAHNLLMYAAKSIVPFSQSAFYDYPYKTGNALPAVYYVAALPVLIIVLLLVMGFIKQKRLFVFSAGYFISTVFLVLMLLPVGPTIFNERYTYVSSVMLFGAAIPLFENLLKQKKFNRTMLISVMVCIAAVYAYITLQRSRVWKDSLTLWTDVVEKFPQAAHALNNKGDAFFNLNAHDSAIVYFSRALAINSSYASALFNRGNAYGITGKPELALKDLNLSIELDPSRAEAFNKRGQALALTGQTRAALNDFNKALQMKPDYAEVYFNLGITYLNMNNKSEACANLQKAVNMGFGNALEPLNQVCK